MPMQLLHIDPSNNMGTLLAITILIALLVDFLFLSPSLMFLYKKMKLKMNKRL
jgi:hypothetical protein